IALKRNDGLARNGLEFRYGLAGTFSHCRSDVIRETDNPAVRYIAIELESVRNVRGHDKCGGRCEADSGSFQNHFAAAALDEQELKKVPMAMRPDQPVMRG